MRKNLFLSWAFTLAALLIVILETKTVDAQEGLSLKLDDTLTFKSDARHMPGHLSANQSSFAMTCEFKAFEKLPASLGYSHSHWDINENTPVNLPSRLEGHRFLAGAKFPMPFNDSDQYFVGLDLMPSWYTDNGRMTSSSFRLPFHLYGIYKPEDNFLMVFGATVNVQADTPVVPIIGFNYKPDDHWDIHLASSEPTISYKIFEWVSLYGEYGGTLDEYEVKRSGQKGVVLKVRNATLGGGIKLHLEKCLEFSLSAGRSMARQFEYRDTVGKVNVDSAPYIKARLNLLF